jgi:hypothetical protein
MKTSKFLSLNWLDIGKGFLVAFGAFGLNYAQEVLLPQLDLSPEVKTLIYAGLAYLGKNFFTKPKEE